MKGGGRGEAHFLWGSGDSHRKYAVLLDKLQPLLTRFVWNLLQGRTFTVK